MTDVLKSGNPQQRFVYFVMERESIRLKREKGEPPPWTKDPILAKYRFTNVRRMDDRVSKWLFDNWYKPNLGHPNMLVAVALARHINLPVTLEEIGFPLVWNPEHIKQVVRRRMAHGLPTWSAAYMVRGIGTADKIEMVVDNVCQPLIDNPPKIDTASMERSVAVLLPYWGFSSFMAGQVVADLRWAMSGSWMDKNIWAPVGPGSLKGMNIFHGRPEKQPISQRQFCLELLDMIAVLKSQLSTSITDRLEAMDYQNICCEMSKYDRTLFGRGKPKQLYRPGSV